MTSGLVKMLCCLSMMESKGEVTEFLKTFMFTFLGFFHTVVCMLILLLVYIFCVFCGYDSSLFLGCFCNSCYFVTRGVCCGWIGNSYMLVVMYFI